MADAWLTLFFIWHIGSVIVWLGSASTFALSISPSLRNMSNEVKMTFIYNFMPRFLKLFGGASISAILAGTLLYSYLVSINSHYLPSGWRFVFIGSGAFLGIVASIISLGVVVPMGNKLADRQPANIENAGVGLPSGAGLSKHYDTVAVINSSIRSVVIILATAFIMMVMSVYF